MKRAGETLRCAWADRLDGRDLASLSDESLAELVAHAEGCAACQLRLGEAEIDDTLADALREAAAEQAELAVDVAPPPGRLGELLPDYEILGELGRGGMGVVYRARQRSLDRVVALKILPALLATVRPTAARRFRREAALAAKLSHTHIIGVHEFGESGGTLFYAMELVEGRSLRDLLAEVRERGGISGPGAGSAQTGWSGSAHETARAYFRQAAAWAADVASALQFAHDRGVLHRDIKPSNLIVAHDGRIKITDFGLARPTHDLSLTATRSIVGTVRYIAPERVDPTLGTIDGRADVYSLGATLYEMLTLRPVFDADHEREILKRLTEEDPPSPSRAARHLPRELSTICHKAIARSPADRYQSAAAMEEDLRRWLLDLPVHARPIGPAVRAWRCVKRRPAASGLAVGVAVLAVLTGTLGASAHRSAREAHRAGAAADELRVQTLLTEARRLRTQGEFESALRRCDDADAVLEHVVDTALVRASVLMSLRRRPEAVLVLEPVVRRHPEHADARMMLALAIGGEEPGLNPEAAGHLREVARHRPGTAVGYYALAVLEPDHAEAVRLLDRAIEQDNQRVELIDYRSNRNFQQGAYAAQLADAEKLVAMRPRLATSHRRLGTALAGLQRYREADAALTEAIRLDPTDHLAWHNRSQVRAESDRLDEAIADALRVLELSPEYCHAYHTLAKARASKGQIDAAIADIERGLRCEPDSPSMLLMRGRLHYMNGDLHAMVADASRVIELDPAHRLAYNHRAVGLNALGRCEDAVADLRRSIELDPRNALDHVNLGEMWLRLHRPLDAAAAYAEAVRLQPNNPAHLVQRAEAYWRGGRPHLCIADLIRSEELGSQDLKAHLLRGWAYWELGLTDLALEAWDTAASATPRLTNLCRALRHLALLEAGRSDDARAALETEDADPRDWWLVVMLPYLRGELELEQALALAGTPSDRAQLLYYAGAQAVVTGDTQTGRRLLAECIAIEHTDIIERPAARRMLERLGETPAHEGDVRLRPRDQPAS